MKLGCRGHGVVCDVCVCMGVCLYDMCVMGVSVSMWEYTVCVCVCVFLAQASVLTDPILSSFSKDEGPEPKEEM